MLSLRTDTGSFIVKDLSQQPITFTGQLNSLTRLQAQQLAVMLGAFPQTNMNKKVKYVITGQIE